MAAAAAPCPPSAPPTGSIVRVTTDAALQAAVRNLASGTTVLIADGVYDLSNTLHLQGGIANVALRGESGDRDAVVLQGQGMGNANFGSVPHGFLVSDATDVLIADLTISDVYFHAVQIAGERGATRITLRNLRLIDAGEQLVKGSTAGPPGPYADDCVVECCLLEYTDRARSWYTNGVDVLAGARWIVRDNVFRRIRAPIGQLAGPSALFWRNSIDTVVERNVFIECDRGVALGLSPPDANSRDGELVFDHQGGIVRNNTFSRAAGSPTGDVGISVNYCGGYRILHNTVMQGGSFPWTIEWRFSSSDGIVANNLTDGPLVARDGARAAQSGNVTSAAPSWFVDASVGDLHLLDTATGARDVAPPLADVTDDLDGQPRPQGPLADVGADEIASCAMPTIAVTGLLVMRAGADVLLAWDRLPGDPLYNVWYVVDRRDCDLTRLSGSPPAIGVVGCAEPTPAPGSGCGDAGAVGRGSALHFYNVRGTCGGATEGP